MDADDGDVITQWAVAGEGIAMKPVFEVAEHLKSGALVPVLPDCPPTQVTLAVLHAYRRMVPMKVKAFADLLVDDMRQHVAQAVAGLGHQSSRPGAPLDPQLSLAAVRRAPRRLPLRPPGCRHR